MNNAGFYKKENNEINYAPNYVEGQGYALFAIDKATYEYPVDGWIWAQSEEDAISYFETANETVAPFDVRPENYKLAAGKTDEEEFMKLVTLSTLALSQNRFEPSTELTIWDHIKTPRTISVQRFLEVMVDYGMYCYALRN